LWIFRGTEHLLVLAATVPVTAKEVSRLDTVLEREVLRVGTTGDYKPFTYLNKETGAFEGIDIDMAKSLAAEGCQS